MLIIFNNDTIGWCGTGPPPARGGGQPAGPPGAVRGAGVHPPHHPLLGPEGAAHASCRHPVVPQPDRARRLGSPGDRGILQEQRRGPASRHSGSLPAFTGTAYIGALPALTGTAYIGTLPASQVQRIVQCT